MASDGELRIGAIGDLHCPRVSLDELQSLFTQVAECSDVVLLCGDITDYGKAEEARLLVAALPVLKGIPVVAVLGNHDYESGDAETITQILERQGIHVLDGTSTEIGGVEFVGVKGFAGGFGDRLLQSWGESALKQFVRESVEEALKLESALAKLRTAHRIVLLHYAPIIETVIGEAPEIIPFLGTSRLEDPINRYGTTAVFHGHAHHGTVEGCTQTGIPVYNVALPLLRRQRAQHPPFRAITLKLTKSAETA
ncbi:MAG: metallophosphoesterase [Nitrospira sp.]|nr:metallophosphoesterase [Nitrospira sp.]